MIRLPVVIQSLFASSDKREDNLIVGYALGGSFVVKSSGYEVLFLGAGAIVLLNGLILLMFQRTPKKAASCGTEKRQLIV